MLESLVAQDLRVFTFMHQWAAYGGAVWKWIAISGVYVIPVILLWYWFFRKRETAFFAALAGIFSWQILNNFIGAFISRDRPVPFIELHFPEKEFIFDRPGPSFPSDHTAFMVAVTVAFWLAGDRRVGSWLGVITILTVVARIVTAQHWPGDILVGAFVGLVGVGFLTLIRRPLDRFVISPFIKFVRKIGL